MFEALHFQYFLGGLVSLITITNPPSKMPLFISLTQGMSEERRRQQANWAGIYAAAIMLVSLVCGNVLLDYAFFPIAMPGIAGPGTIAVVIGFSTEIAELPGYIDMAIAFAWTALAILCATSLSWFIMRYSDVISNRLGPSGTLVIGKLMGFLLICIGVQFVGSGIRTFIAGG